MHWYRFTIGSLTILTVFRERMDIAGEFVDPHLHRDDGGLLNYLVPETTADHF